MLPVTLPPANTVPKRVAVGAEREVEAETERSTVKEKADTGMDTAIATEKDTAMGTDTGIPAAGDMGRVVMETAEEMETAAGRAHEMVMDGGKAPATGTTAGETAMEREGKVPMKAGERAPETARAAENCGMTAKVEESQETKILQFQILLSGKRADGTVNFPRKGRKERIQHLL